MSREMRARWPALAISACIACMLVPASALTVSGTILTADATWGIGQSPIELSGTVVVDRGATLTITRGAEVVMASGAVISVRGALRIEGHPLQPVNVTGATKSRGAWNRIVFESSAVPYNETSGEGSIITNTFFEFGGSADGTIRIDGASPRIENVEITESKNDGVYHSGTAATADIRKLTIRSVGRDGVSFSNPSLPGCTEQTPCLMDEVKIRGARYGSYVYTNQVQWLVASNWDVAECSSHPIYVYYGFLRLQNSTVHSANTYAIYSYRGSILASNSTIASDSSWGAYGEHRYTNNLHFVFDDCNLDRSKYGLHVNHNGYTCTVAVRGCSFKNNYGRSIDLCIPSAGPVIEVSDNVFENNNVADGEVVARVRFCGAGSHPGLIMERNSFQLNEIHDDAGAVVDLRFDYRPAVLSRIEGNTFAYNRARYSLPKFDEVQNPGALRVYVADVSDPNVVVKFNNFLNPRIRRDVLILHSSGSNVYGGTVDASQNYWGLLAPGETARDRVYDSLVAMHQPTAQLVPSLAAPSDSCFSAPAISLDADVSEAEFGAQRVFEYTGAPVDYVVPSGTTSLRVVAWGAGGGGGFERNSGTTYAGAGGFVEAVLPVTPGEVLTIRVGGGGLKRNGTVGGAGGWNGGGNGGSVASGYGGGGGGGATALYRGDELLLVAAGGGGMGSATNVDMRGGNGGGIDGASGQSYSSYAIGGEGATSLRPGQGFIGTSGTVTLHVKADDGVGMRGGDGAGNPATSGGGGGGGGAFSRSQQIGGSASLAAPSDGAPRIQPRGPAARAPR
eukprot:m.254803 g.254803  ORF g.254803 m.254803 type:complete len:791 (-) comp11007_c2_seq3:3620-5992(-)